jgi:glucokinase
MADILADIGGTYVRFAQAQGPDAGSVSKYSVRDFPGVAEALAQYCAEREIQPRGRLRIATAGYEDEGAWKFVNNNTWHIRTDDLRARGWDVALIINDFEAATWALSTLGPGEKTLWRPGAGASNTLCLIGPGTGLGLGYWHPLQKPFVQKTHGGHMPVSATTDEQWRIIQIVRTHKPVPVFENVVSGPGLDNLYSACCQLAGMPRAFEKIEDITAHADHPPAKQALRLFHEFMGLAAANAVITGHAYGGLYLTGGVLERLVSAELFDLPAFLEFFDLEVAASVRRDLRATPVYFITIPNPALKGLLVAA